MSFNLNEAQEEARKNLSSDYLSGDDKQAMFQQRRPFYIHDAKPRTYSPTANKEDDVDQWAFAVEFIDDLGEQEMNANGGKPVIYTLTLGSNAYRDGLGRTIAKFISDNNQAIGPLRLVRMEDYKGKGQKPWDFAPWVRGVDDVPQPAPTGRAAASGFRPRADAAPAPAAPAPQAVAQPVEVPQTEQAPAPAPAPAPAAE